MKKSMFILVLCLLFCLVFVGGCGGTINGLASLGQGLASDLEEVCGAIKRESQPEMDRREQQKLERAAEKVLAGKNYENQNQ